MTPNRECRLRALRIADNCRDLAHPPGEGGLRSRNPQCQAKLSARATAGTLRATPASELEMIWSKAD